MCTEIFEKHFFHVSEPSPALCIDFGPSNRAYPGRNDDVALGTDRKYPLTRKAVTIMRADRDVPGGDELATEPSMLQHPELDALDTLEAPIREGRECFWKKSMRWKREKILSPH